MEIDGQIRLKDVPEGLLHSLQKQLTVNNPKFQSALRMGFPTYNIPQRIMLYRVENNQLIVPRGLWADIWRIRPGGTVKSNFTQTCEEISFSKSTLEMRDYQQQALDTVAMSKSPQGVIVMPCGAGKTETALQLIANLKQPCLWITHTQDLVQGTYDRAVERLGLSPPQIGIYSGKRAEIGTHMTIATVQTLYRRDLSDMAHLFGCVIVDECHRVVNNPETASMWANVLAQLPAKYRYGITATDMRSDGLTDTIFHILGDKLAQVSQETLKDKGNVITPTVYPMVTGFTYHPAVDEHPINFTRLARCLDSDQKRSEDILSNLAKQLHDGHSCLVLATNLSILESLYNRIKALGYPAEFISGKSKAEKRKTAIADMRTKHSRCLFATYALAKEGLDIPVLDRLFFATPIRNQTAVQQSIGRIMRPAPGKIDAVIFDYVDKLVPVCKGQFCSRKKIYNKLNCTIEQEIQL
ncbi:MAG: DEAD/DEAH box helicase [Oscillospiraceae bacterium]